MNADLPARVAELEVAVRVLTKRVEMATRVSAILRNAGMPWQAEAAKECHQDREKRHLKVVGK